MDISPWAGGWAGTAGPSTLPEYHPGIELYLVFMHLSRDKRKFFVKSGVSNLFSEDVLCAAGMRQKILCEFFVIFSRAACRSTLRLRLLGRCL